MQNKKEWGCKIQRSQWQAYGKSIKDVWDVKTYVTNACHSKVVRMKES